jgi:16S rRNA processing protein RimM
MIEKEDCTHIGVVSKIHGIAGEVVVKLLNGIEGDDLETDCLFLELEGGLVPFMIDSWRDRGDGSLLVIFEMIASEAAARRVVDAPVWIDNADMTAITDEGAHSSLLVGYSVHDKQHGLLGKIIEVRDPERNPHFAIDGANGEILVPIVDEYMLSLDRDQKILYIEAPEGLIELYM